MDTATHASLPPEAQLNVELLESSFKLVVPRAPEFVDAFYAKLFQLYPETQQFFTSTDMTQQRNKLIAALVLVIENLRHPQSLIPALSALGQKHQSYNIGPAHYPMVGSALLQTFSEFLGDRWNAEVEEAWTQAYGVITQAMLSGYSAPHAP